MKVIRIKNIMLCVVMLSISFQFSGPVNANENSSMTYHEAPMLIRQVAAGQLPPVDQRLPDSPVIITPLSQGRYGGTWRTVSWWDGIGNILLKMYDPPIRWKADYSGYEPGLAEGYGWSADGKVFTLHLRPGLKWSDGAPYTSQDWRFWWEDMALDDQYPSVNVPAWLRKSNGDPVTMHFLDDYTVTWTSDREQWVYPYFIAQGHWEFAVPMMKPAHYLRQFHPRYTPGATYSGLEAVDRWWENPDFPTVLAWRCSEVKTSGGILVNTFERNPYYWKVDTAGNQLPYIDTIRVEIIPDAQERLSRTANGYYDATFRGLGGGPNDIPFLQANAQEHGYHLQPGWMNGAGAWPGYLVNQDYVAGGGNYPDDTLEHAEKVRALLRDKRFRKALSIGFNRQEVINIAWDGHGTPQQATISPQSMHFSSPAGQLVYQNWAASDATENLTQANLLLNQAGMLDSNADGWRDLPGGLPFTLIIDINDWGGIYDVQALAAQEMKHQWEINLAIKVKINDLQNNWEIETRMSNGYYMLRAGHVSELDCWTYPDWIFPVYNRYMFPLEGLWYETNGIEGIAPEPGSPAALLQALYKKGMAEKDFNQRQQIIYEAIQIYISEGPFNIGVAGDQPMPVVIKNNFHNVPEFGVLGPWAPASPGNMFPEQFWIEQEFIYLPLIRR